MNRGIDKSLQIKTGSESARRPRQHNPLPTGEVVCSVFELREEATHLARRQKKAKLPSGKTLTGFTKQFTCSAPEPIFPTGTKAPKLTAAMLRVASTDGDALRFMGTIKGRLRQSSLSMNRAGCGSQTRGPDRASVRRSGSWSQCATEKSWRLSMNNKLRSSRREEAHFSNAERGVWNAELSRSLTSAATVQGHNARCFFRGCPHTTLVGDYLWQTT